MAEKNTTLYHLESVENSERFERAIKEIKGVTFAKVDLQEMTLEYAIDEWSSDYDVFTEVMARADECGVVFDFAYTEKKRESIKEFEITGNEEMESEFIAHGLEVEKPEEEKEVKETKAKELPKRKKRLSQIVERSIEIGASLIFLIISFFVTDFANFIMLSLAFALAGYDVLYRAFEKILKKQIFSEELLISIALLCCVFVGDATQAVGACLAWTLCDFLATFINGYVKHGSVAYFEPESITVLDERGLEKQVEIKDVKVGDKCVYLAGDLNAIDAVACEEISVIDENGETVTIAEGGRVVAGVKFIAESTVCTTCLPTENANYAKNEIAKRALSSKSELEENIGRAKRVYLPVLFLACLVIAFVLPLSSESYKQGLIRWGYAASIIAATSGWFITLSSLTLGIYKALAYGKKQGVSFSGYGFCERVKDVTQVAIDAEHFIFDANGEVKADVWGAIRELKDCGISKITLVASKSEKYAEQLCKDLKIHEFYANRNDAEKTEIMKKLCDEGCLCVCELAENGEEQAQNIEEQAEGGASVAFNSETHSNDSSASVTDGDVRKLPLLVKLAKRVTRLEKIAYSLYLTSKIAIALLALFGVAELWIAVVIDLVFSGAVILNALRNGSEVI